MKPKIAVAVSGGGRTLQNFLSLELPFEVGAVISSSPKAGALHIAAQHAVPVFIDDFRSVDAHELDQWLKAQGILWVALAGFLKKFPVLPSFENRVINIHPSLLPAYGGHGMYGMRVHEAVFAAQETHSGATVHFVNEHYDEGSMIAQATTEIRGLTSAQSIADQVFALECQLYPKVLALLLDQQLPLSEGRLWHFGKDN